MSAIAQTQVKATLKATSTNAPGISHGITQSVKEILVDEEVVEGTDSETEDREIDGNELDEDDVDDVAQSANPTDNPL